ncbi:MAG: hypothetical protein JXR36_00575 [Bacteroidales bacterium]|nr:hypothetical protein [Bacteroidales bacterium]
MNKIISIFVFAAVLIFTNACNETKQKNENQTDTVDNSTNYLSVDDVFAQGDSLTNKTIHVEGIIEHVCKHTWKRFKITTGDNEFQFIKIELGDKFQTIDSSIIGKTVRVTGKLKPVRMDSTMMSQWEKSMQENHKGEEDTNHYKEELAFIQRIQKQIIMEEIPYYTNFTIEAENYELK